MLSTKRRVIDDPTNPQAPVIKIFKTTAFGGASGGLRDEANTVQWAEGAAYFSTTGKARLHALLRGIWEGQDKDDRSNETRIQI